jgi:alpha-tubulin suppressor-like RCC1 family protein
VRFSTLTAGLGTIATETCGLTTTQRAYCWGTRIYYDVSTWSADEPDSVPTSLTFVRLQSGVSHLCGIATGGAAYCLGSNYSGELGAGLTWTQLEYADTLVAVSGGITFSSIAVGVNYACGLDGDGAAWCWGENTYGQLGAGDTTDTDCGFFHDLRCVHTPVAVSGGLTYRWLTAGRNHTCGLTTGGTLYCWGANGASQLGTTAALPTCAGGSASRPAQPCADAPRVVSFPGGTQPPLSAATAGGAHTCALSVDGDLYCWGSDQHGQLGLGGSAQSCAGSLACRAQPTRVTGTHFFAASAGYEHTCAMTAADEAYCWGANERGQLGDGTFLDRSRPVAVRRPT